MTRPRHDPLLSALIARLPADAAPWPRDGRIAWLQMMAMAFDVVYGPCGAIGVTDGAPRGAGPVASSGAGSVAGSGVPDHRGEPGAFAPSRETEHCAAPQRTPPLARRFHVDRDGFAMGDGRPIAMEDLPAGAILWDERTGIESGDASAILWRDVGTSRERLPAGVTLRPVFDET